MPATSRACGPEPGGRPARCYVAGVAEPNGEFPSCSVCGRSLLRGERLASYLTPEGEEAGVCALCKPRAEASGWIPAALAGDRAQQPGPRRRGRLNLRELLGRRGEREAPGTPAAEAEPPRPAPEPRREPTPPAPPPEPEPEPDPLDSFNASPAARTVSGLRRSLGEPQVAVREEGDAHLITVAWELSWYQWRVADGTVEEVGKGSEISELAGEDTGWNASLTEDGELELA